VGDGDGPGVRAADHAEAVPDDAAARRVAAPAVLPRWERGHAGGRRGALRFVPRARAQRAAAGRPGRVPEVTLIRRGARASTGARARQASHDPHGREGAGMGAGPTELQGPDLREGVALDALPEGHPFLGHADGEQVLLVRNGGTVRAIGATCTHWGGPLAEGLVVEDTIRCPWHHACFSLRTGEPLGAPALNPVACWTVEVRDGTVRVTGKEEHPPLSPRGRSADGPE